MKPEAAYFYAEDGKRSALVFYEMDDASRIPAVAESWFLALNARVEIKPVMVADDLAKAGPAIEDAVRVRMTPSGLLGRTLGPAADREGSPGERPS